MIYFASDLHFGHKNILKFDNRPFKTIEEHDQTLIKNWNETVTDKDDVYFLGDFSFKNPLNYISQLKGNLYFVKGNHDGRETINAYKKHGVLLDSIYDLNIDDNHIVLSHYPIEEWNRAHHGSYHLHGHRHGSVVDNPNLRRMDVGINCIGYKPISWDEIKKRLEKNSYLKHH